MPADAAHLSPCPAVENDPLRLVICPACGYSLQGLPAEGVCPECGGPYDQSAIILHGWEQPHHANAHNGPPWLAAAGLLLPAICVVMAFFDLQLGRPTGGWWVIASAIFAVPTLQLLWRRWTTPLPGFIQIRLDSSDCIQIDDPPHPPNTTPTRWDQIQDVQLVPSTRGRYHLRLESEVRRPWWRFGRVPVDAQVALSIQQAEALRRWIDTRRRQGRRTQASGG
jgi:hypothetical protein